MGPINMMALEEYNECEQRFEFLGRERDDLLQSITDTQQAITELDEVCKQKFEEAFAVINANFATAFHTLFGGGTGEMRLSEPDSSGEPGIDIVAQPPGKRLQNVLLLSGGEKAHDRAGAAHRHLPLPAEPVLHPGRSGRAAGRNQRRPLHQDGLGDERGHAVHRRHAQPAHDGDGFGAVRRDHAGAGRLETGLRELGEPAAAQAATNAA